MRRIPSAAWLLATWLAMPAGWWYMAGHMAPGGIVQPVERTRLIPAWHPVVVADSDGAIITLVSDRPVYLLPPLSALPVPTAPPMPVAGIAPAAGNVPTATSWGGE